MSLTPPVNPPAMGPNRMPEMITGISPKPMRRAGRPASGIIYEKTLVRTILIAANNPHATKALVLNPFFVFNILPPFLSMMTFPLTTLKKEAL